MAITRPGLAKRCCCHIAALAATALGSCAKQQPVLEGIGGPAPNPNGCYVFVYDETDWRGERAVLNGPTKWGTVERLRLDDKDWRNRIRSLEVGPTATVTLYTELNYKGAAQQFGPASKPARFDGRLGAGVESLDVTCAAKTP
jgi:hypothetical protein